MSKESKATPRELREHTELYVRNGSLFDTWDREFYQAFKKQNHPDSDETHMVNYRQLQKERAKSARLLEALKGLLARQDCECNPANQCAACYIEAEFEGLVADYNQSEGGE